MNLSVIIPVHNGGKSFERCLKSFTVSMRSPDEVIVVDDASTDTSAASALAANMQVISIQGKPRGPAFARNQGALAAHGDILIFLDADVALHHDTLACIERYFLTHPDIVAVFGSYDENPLERSIVSLYKNLQHHYVHQHGNQVSSTFWAGCGAIRRNVFESIGGFSEQYDRPSIEDIELGRRLNHSGYLVWLCSDIQVSHLKRWTLTDWLKSDIFDRAIPWSRLILREAYLPADLNLNWRSRLSAFAAWASILCSMMGFFMPCLWIVSGFCFALIIIINLDMYCFFARKGGFFFTIASILFHFLYFLYSSAIFIIMVARYKLHIS
jgi:glycosyltransferase involved in cell wall biosynthesis